MYWLWLHNKKGGDGVFKNPKYRPPAEKYTYVTNILELQKLSFREAAVILVRRLCKPMLLAMLYSKLCLWAKRKHGLHIQIHTKPRIHWKSDHKLKNPIKKIYSRFTCIEQERIPICEKVSIIMQLKLSYNYFLVSTPFPGIMLILPVLFWVLRLTASFWSRAVRASHHHLESFIGRNMMFILMVSSSL